MNMSKKSGDKAKGCGESTFSHTAKKICRKVMFRYLIIYFNDQKRDVTSSVMWSKHFECFGSFLKYLFCHKLASFCCFSQRFFTLYCLWAIIIPFSKQNQKKTVKPILVTTWPILQVNIEKETYSWDFCKILF